MRRYTTTSLAIVFLGALGAGNARATGPDDNPTRVANAGGCFSSPGSPDASVFATASERQKAALRSQYYHIHPPLHDDNLGERVRERTDSPNEDNRNPQPDHDDPANKNPQPDHLAN